MVVRNDPNYNNKECNINKTWQELRQAQMLKAHFSSSQYKQIIRKLRESVQQFYLMHQLSD